MEKIETEHYSQSYKYKKNSLILKPYKDQFLTLHNQLECLQYVLKNAIHNNPYSVIQAIDKFCQNSWMMNLGSEKSLIIRDYIQKYNPKKILEIGGYCGYSALVYATYSGKQSLVYSVEINSKFIEISAKILEFAGLNNKVKHFFGNCQQNKQKIQQLGSIDLLFIDHQKTQYLSDFKLIQSLNILKSGSVIIGDNIIDPGAPDYHSYFKESSAYKTTFYYCNLEYSTDPDGILVSIKL